MTPGTPQPLPALYCPLPVAIHPLSAQADASAAAWLHRFRLGDSPLARARLARSGCGRMASYLLPAATPEVLAITADLCAWNLAFDDEYCDEGSLGLRPGDLAEALAHIRRALEVPETQLYPDDRYAVALHDIRTRLDACATPVQVARWADGIHIWLSAEPWRAAVDARGGTMTLDEYALLRLKSGGMFAFIALAPVANGYEVEPRDLVLRPVQALTEIAATLGTWGADIIGHLRDRRDEHGNNLLTVIRHADDCDLAEAVIRAAEMYGSIMHLYLTLRARILPTCNPPLARHLVDLDRFIRTGIDWVAESHRYAGAAEPDLRPNRPVPSTTALAPLPLPAIAWWWHLADDPQ
ncbi:hypothetical protein ACFWIQ_33740 [Kitasatospora sp. NPDC127059]|uniref:terpene synthase family protein n=1 Tax=unclassified Kitasatospora TaxID=2633591 RepID=UPI00364C3BA5